MVASFRTREGGFRYRISLPYRRSLFFTPNASENASRTPGSLFEHRMRIPYRRRPSPVPNAANGRKEKSIACSECHNCQKRRDQCKKRSPGCRREQENHSQKVCNTAPNLLNISRKSRCRQNPLNATPKKVTQCPRNLRRLLQVESADPSGGGLQRPTYTNAERQPQGTVVHLWSGKRDSDPRPQPWQGCALPTELFPQYNPVPRGWDYKGTEFFFICKLFLNFFVRVCSRVAEYGFAVFAVYHNLAVLAYFTFKDFLCKLVDQFSLNQSFDRTGTIFRIVAVLYHVVFKRFRE